MYSVKELAPCPKGLVLFFYHPAPVAQPAEQRSLNHGSTVRYSSVQNRNHETQGGGMDTPIVIIGSCVAFAACLITLWLMP
jgi:hypothetical protein